MADSGEALGGRVQLHWLRRGHAARLWLDACWQTPACQQIPACHTQWRWRSEEGSSRGRCPFFLCGYEGPRGDGAMTGGRWLSPILLSAKELVPPATWDPARVYPGSALGEDLEGVWSIPAAYSGLPAQCPPAAPCLPVPCLDWCSRTPALEELGPGITQASEWDRKGTKPPCPLGHPGGGGGWSCPTARGHP